MLDKRFIRIAGIAVVALGSASACSGGGGGAPAPAPRPSETPVATNNPGTTPTPTSAPGTTATPTGAPTATPSPTPHATATATPTPHVTATPTAASTGSYVADDWPVFGHDPARSGVSNESTGVTHASVSLTKLWQVNVGTADASPVVKGSMLFITLDNGTSYGISTATGATMWTFPTTGTKMTTAGPAYDVAGGELYVPGIDAKIHRLNPATGAEDTSHGFPVTVTLAPQTEKVASPLNVANGYVYATTSGYNGDAPPYIGHVAAISTSNGAIHVFNSLCSSQTGLIAPSSCSQSDSGIWSRGGAVVDPDSAMSGRVYAATGNGDYNQSQGDYGDAILALTPDASSLVQNFTPTNTASLDSSDEDLGSTAPALLPRLSGVSTPLLAVQSGKDGVLRLLDRSNLSPAGTVLQSITLGAGVYSAPAVYKTSTGRTFVYVAIRSGLKAFELVATGGTPTLVSSWTSSLTIGGEGTSPAVRDGVVYVAASNELVALDAISGATLGTNSSLGGVHWQSPAIAHGVVYCNDTAGNLTAFAIGN